MTIPMHLSEEDSHVGSAGRDMLGTQKRVSQQTINAQRCSTAASNRARILNLKVGFGVEMDHRCTASQPDFSVGQNVTR